MQQVAINGLGRIGRLALRQLLTAPGVDLVAVNDLADAATLAHLLKYDSVHGQWPIPVAVDGNDLLLGGHRIRVFNEAHPSRIPFGASGAQVVLECTGAFTHRTDAAAHLREGVSHVLISAQAEDADRTVLLGVNEGSLNPVRDRILSAACSTTQCLAPVVKVLDDAFGLEYGFMTSVHSYTNEQRILDLPHEDLRMARAATLSMIPVDTAAAEIVGRLLPHLKGRLNGLMVHVPTPDVSLLDLTATLRTDITLEAIHEAFQQAATEGPLAPCLDVLQAELVSVDLVGTAASAHYDPFLTKLLGPRMVKVFAWYDNEFAYAARLKDLCLHLLERL